MVAVILNPDRTSVKLPMQLFLLRLTKISPQDRMRRRDDRDNKTVLSVSTLSDVALRSVSQHLSQHQRLQIRHKSKNLHQHERRSSPVQTPSHRSLDLSQLRHPFRRLHLRSSLLPRLRLRLLPMRRPNDDSNRNQSQGHFRT
jgi:hypothetical protein